MADRNPYNLRSRRTIESAADYVPSLQASTSASLFPLADIGEGNLANPTLPVTTVAPVEGMLGRNISNDPISDRSRHAIPTQTLVPVESVTSETPEHEAVIRFLDQTVFADRPQQASTPVASITRISKGELTLAAKDLAPLLDEAFRVLGNHRSYSEVEAIEASVLASIISC